MWFQSAARLPPSRAVISPVLGSGEKRVSEIGRAHV